jgi:hypothetical protein
MWLKMVRPRHEKGRGVASSCIRTSTQAVACLWGVERCSNGDGRWAGGGSGGNREARRRWSFETLKHVSMFQRNNSKFFLQIEKFRDRIRPRSKKRSCSSYQDLQLSLRWEEQNSKRLEDRTKIRLELHIKHHVSELKHSCFNTRVLKVIF